MAAERFLAQPVIRVDDLVAFVKVAQPNARLRDSNRLNVRVGNHIAPRGGIQIVEDLTWLCLRASRRIPNDVYPVHVSYETLHPFLDGNGRSGRILWLWMVGGIERAPLGFLHSWYYQSLQHSREV